MKLIKKRLLKKQGETFNKTDVFNKYKEIIPDIIKKKTYSSMNNLKEQIYDIQKEVFDNYGINDDTLELFNDIIEFSVEDIAISNLITSDILLVFVQVLNDFNKKYKENYSYNKKSIFDTLRGVHEEYIFILLTHIFMVEGKDSYIEALYKSKALLLEKKFPYRPFYDINYQYYFVLFFSHLNADRTKSIGGMNEFSELINIILVHKNLIIKKEDYKNLYNFWLLIAVSNDFFYNIYSYQSKLEDFLIKHCLDNYNNNYFYANNNKIIIYFSDNNVGIIKADSSIISNIITGNTASLVSHPNDITVDNFINMIESLNIRVIEVHNETTINLKFLVFDILKDNLDIKEFIDLDIYQFKGKEIKDEELIQVLSENNMLTIESCINLQLSEDDVLAAYIDNNINGIRKLIELNDVSVLLKEDIEFIKQLN